MNLFSRSRFFAAAIVLGTAGISTAADTPVVAAPVVNSVPCASCAAPAGAPCRANCTAKGCKTCFGLRTKTPFQTHLCPGACFGYFQTQWSKWEDVCPMPYHGQGFSDAPTVRTTPVAPVRTTDPKDVKKGIAPDPKKLTDPMKGGELPLPRPGGTDPKNGTGRSTSLPSIPQAPPTLPIPSGRFGGQ